jgi:predicted phosphodiesterase
MKLIVAISDLQVPYHDKRAVANVAKFIKAVKPDTVVSVGDEMDFQTISRWSQGTPLEYERTIDRDRNATVQVLEDLRVDHVIRSNHTDRLFNTVMMRAPGLLSLPELELPNFLRFPELGITYHKDPYELAPGWLLMHGDEGNVSQNGGTTALNLAKRTGMSVVCGHTHRMGLTHHSESFMGKQTRTLWGMEVGNLMDAKKASYLKGGISNWHQGFGVLWVDGKKVTPQVIPISPDGTFTFQGKIWGK